MSFSSTPLGQDRRLDHQAFLKGQSYTYATNPPPPRRVPSINKPVPTSYAYGAPNLASRTSTITTTSHQPSQIGRTVPEESDEEGRRSRYAQLKQRNEALANRPGSSLGPGVITTPPFPTPATLNPTSVNIASAFYQAAYNMPPTASAWAKRSEHLPRSTSKEYEEQAQGALHRRLPAPPKRAGGSKPPSSNKSGFSFSRGSDVENDRSGESLGTKERGKSPFEHISDLAQRAVSTATFVMRQRSQEPEVVHPPSRQTTDATLVPNGDSYEYDDEEAEFQESQKASAKKAASTSHKRNRMSTDNKAYRPTISEEEDESEEDSDGEKRGRRRGKKRESGGGPLTNMPTIQYDKRKKKKGRTGKSGEEDNSVEDEQEQEQASEQRGRRSVDPLNRRTSLPRNSAPNSRNGIPSDTSRSYNTSGPTDESGDLEAGLDSIPEEVEEPVLVTPVKTESRASAKHSGRPRSRSRTRPARQSAIGGPLGKLVFSIITSVIRLVSIPTFIFGRFLGLLFTSLVSDPILFVRRHVIFKRAGVLGVAAVAAYFAFMALSSLDLISMAPSRSRTPYIAPTLPPQSVDELTSRLLKLENMLAGLQSEAINERIRYDSDLRRAQEIASKVIQLESRVEKEAVRMKKSGDEARDSTQKGLDGVQRELRALKAQQAEQASRSQEPSSDEEARAKVRTLEERIGTIEGGAKEALELAQSVAKAGTVVAGAGAGSSSHWWNKLGTNSGTGLTIKTSDGSDVTPLIGALVQKAIMHYTADGIARPDFALSSGGAGVIPSLTSPTLEIKTSYFFGLITGASLYARSPVTALHHEAALGYCWPFAGSQGHLGVKLATPVRVSDFTIDHVARPVALDMRPAPRNMEVWGLVEGEDNLEKLGAYRARLEAERQSAIDEGRPVPEEPVRPDSLPKGVEYMRISTFMYDINSPHNIQTFSVPDDVKELGLDFGVVALFVNDNWGMDEFTCLYRFRVHGERKLELPAPNP